MNYSFEIMALLNHSVAFDKLHSKFNQFNPFKVLRVDKFEIRHSHVIAWLLDPNGNHNLGDFFVNKLLSKTFIKVENEGFTDRYNFIKIHRSSFHDLKVFREALTEQNKRIDILAISEAEKLVILIENKYKSSESKEQLRNYIDFLREKYADYTIIPILLSLDGVAPSHEDYLILDYSDILSILKDYMTINDTYMSQPVKDFIVIGEKTPTSRNEEGIAQ